MEAVKREMGLGTTRPYLPPMDQLELSFLSSFAELQERFRPNNKRKARMIARMVAWMVARMIAHLQHPTGLAAMTANTWISLSRNAELQEQCQTADPRGGTLLGTLSCLPPKPVPLDSNSIRLV